MYRPYLLPNNLVSKKVVKVISFNKFRNSLPINILIFINVFQMENNFSASVHRTEHLSFSFSLQCSFPTHFRSQPMSLPNIAFGYHWLTSMRHWCSIPITACCRATDRYCSKTGRVFRRLALRNSARPRPDTLMAQSARPAASTAAITISAADTTPPAAVTPPPIPVELRGSKRTKSTWGEGLAELFCSWRRQSQIFYAIYPLPPIWKNCGGLKRTIILFELIWA